MDFYCFTLLSRKKNREAFEASNFLYRFVCDAIVLCAGLGIWARASFSAPKKPEILHTWSGEHKIFHFEQTILSDLRLRLL